MGILDSITVPPDWLEAKQIQEALKIQDLQVATAKLAKVYHLDSGKCRSCSPSDAVVGDTCISCNGTTNIAAAASVVLSETIACLDFVTQFHHYSAEYHHYKVGETTVQVGDSLRCLHRYSKKRIDVTVREVRDQ